MSSDSESGPNTGVQFNQIITEGSGYGIHILTTVDTLSRRESLHEPQGAG